MADEKYQGLSGAEVEERVAKGLVNSTGESVSKSKKEIVTSHVFTYFNFLNLFLGLMIVISGQFKSLTFLGVIICNSVIGIYQEFKVKKLVDSLSVITATKAKVIRDGKQEEVPIHELVVDDVVLVETGNQLGADSIVLEAHGIEVNESMLTGESKPVKKKPGDTLMSGSFLVAGSGVAKVEHVGQDNYATVLANKAKNKKRASSEMQDTIKRIIKIISFLIIPIGIMLFISQRTSAHATFSDAIVQSVGGIIGMIPEGLVLLTSVSFILGVGRLAQKRALVQEMEAIEALARVDVLCTDKTGTITTGTLEVVKVEPIGTMDNKAIRGVMNELAFAFDDVNVTQDALMNHFTKSSDWEIEDAIPFSSARKYRAISFKDHGSYVLGAPEFLVKNDPHLMEQVDVYSKDGFRVLLFGSSDHISSEDETVGSIVPQALIVISDCIRPDARETFEFFNKRNVAIKVISGDNPMTVSNIAVKAGLAGGEKYVDANTLPTNIEELKKVVDNYTVYGRVTPEQKQNIIKAYQADKHTVAMVGDGVNDVLALKDADCGIAMAAGSDAAKQVAHIVLLDSDFACMRNIVGEGRTIISNIERVSALYLTKTIYSMVLCVLFIILGRDYPFLPLHLSLISGPAIGIPSFFLALEKNEQVSKGGFLKHVLKTSLPGALTLVIMILGIQLMSDVFGFTGTIKYTYNLLMLGFVSMLVLLKVSSPLNKSRKVIFAISVGLFLGGLLLLPWWFDVGDLFIWRMIFIVPLCICGFHIMKAFVYVMQQVVKAQ